MPAAQEEEREVVGVQVMVLRSETEQADMECVEVSEQVMLPLPVIVAEAAEAVVVPRR